MDSQVYDRITGLTLAVAAVSSILFDRIGTFRWVVGGVAIVSGLVAVGVYLYTQVCSGRRPIAPQIEARHGGGLGLVANRLSRVHQSELLRQQRGFWETYFDFTRRALILSRAAEKRAYSRQKQGELQAVLRAACGPQPWNFVEEVAELIKKLSSGSERGSYEFVLTRGGSFMIKRVRGLGPRIQEPEEYLAAGESPALPFPSKPN